MRVRPTGTLTPGPSLWSNHGLALLLLGLVLLLVLRQTYVVPNTGLGLSPAQLILLGCGVLWVLRFFAGTATGHSLGGVVVLQACALVASYAAAFSRPLTAEESLGASRSLQQVVTISLLTLFVMDTLRTRDEVATVLRWTVGAGAVAGAITLASSVTGIDLGAALTLPGLQVGPELVPGGLGREGVTRAQGTAGHPLELGAVMAFLTPLALTCVVQSAPRGRSAFPWVLATGLIVGAGLSSVSRSAIVVSVLGIVMMSMFWPLRRNVAAGVLLVFATGAVLFSGLPVVGALVASVQGAATDSSLTSRAIGRSYVFDELEKHPWFGLGLGTYGYDQQPLTDNQYFFHLAQAGVLGLAAIILLVLATLVTALRMRKHPDRLTRDLAGGLAGSITVMALLQAVLDTAAFLQISTLAAVTVGCVGALHAASRRTAADAMATLFLCRLRGVSGSPAQHGGGSPLPR